jgi:hypothetical protein
MHASLTPKNNLRLITVFGIALVLFVAFGSVPLALYLIGAVCGVAAGFLQLRAIRQSRPAFLAADDAFAVRRALASSASGKIYLGLFWLAAVIFVSVSLMLLHERFVFGWLAAYCCFVVIRDLLALPATYELQRHASSTDGSTRAI